MKCVVPYFATKNVDRSPFARVDPCSLQTTEKFENGKVSNSQDCDQTLPFCLRSSARATLAALTRGDSVAKGSAV